MIGLDTNVLVRYIMQDDAKQSLAATRLIESLTTSEQGYISLVTIVELSWVLETAYELSKLQVIQALSLLIAVDVFKIDHVSAVSAALRAFAVSKTDFTDHLIERLSKQAGCERTMTFDKAAAKSGGMVLLQAS